MAGKTARRDGGGKHKRSIEDYATVEGYCEGVPVYAFGYTYIYGVSPTLIPNVNWQRGNNARPTKVIPKKSWEIKSNKLGSTPAREPKTAPNDDQPLLCVHLIDGDPETCWCSRGQVQSDVEEAWIRIDLPRASRVNSIALVPSEKGMRASPAIFPSMRRNKAVGQALPQMLTVKVSCDGRHWESVYENRELAPPEGMKPIEISFEPRLVKQLHVVGRGFPEVQNFGHCFSIAGVEIRDEKGENLALHSRGAGVTVSSTHLGYGMDRFTQDMLWPIQYDLGFKWSRVGYDMSAFQWAYVEREKGKLAVDPKADAAVSEAVSNGMNVVMVLDKGNWLYAPTPRRLDRTRELVETYYNWPPTPTESKDYFKAWLRYIRFMVKHFKDRVEYFEIWNEWNPYTTEEARKFCELAKPTIEVIREEHPRAKIIPASPGFFPEFIEGYLREGLGPMIDVIAWHPWYQADPSDKAFRSYPEDVVALKKMAESYGFKGEYMATEWSWFAPYPPSHIDKLHITEMQKAKYAARLTVTHVALEITSFWNETFQTHMTNRDVSLLRNTFSADPISPTQPQPIYYVLRTLSTLLENVKPASMDVRFSFPSRSADLQVCPNGDGEVEWYSFRRGRNEVLLAAWIPGTAAGDESDSQEILTDIVLENDAYETATAYDVLNGTSQPLKVSHRAGKTVLRGMKIRDWPVVIGLG